MRISNFSSMCHFFLISRGRARHFHLIISVLDLLKVVNVTAIKKKKHYRIGSLSNVVKIFKRLSSWSTMYDDVFL